MANDFALAGKTIAQWGEGPVWYNERLYWVDIEGHLVIAYDPVSETETVWDAGERVGTVVPRASGGLVIAGDSGIRALDTVTGKITPIVDPESDLPDNRFNDGKCDPSGRFWCGTMHLRKPREPTGALYRLDAKLKLEKLFGAVTLSNGLAWSAARDTFYYIDTPTEQVVAYNYDDKKGEISRPRLVVDTEEFKGVPDGMALDMNGNLWVAMCHGGEIRCFDSRTGDTLEVLECPTLEVTAPAFGGPDLADLYITTGQSALSKGCELAGRLLRTKAGVKGAPSFAFAG